MISYGFSFVYVKRSVKKIKDLISIMHISILKFKRWTQKIHAK